MSTVQTTIHMNDNARFYIREMNLHPPVWTLEVISGKHDTPLVVFMGCAQMEQLVIELRSAMEEGSE